MGHLLKQITLGNCLKLYLLTESLLRHLALGFAVQASKNRWFAPHVEFLRPLLAQKLHTKDLFLSLPELGRAALASHAPGEGRGDGLSTKTQPMGNCLKFMERLFYINSSK